MRCCWVCACCSSDWRRTKALKARPGKYGSWTFEQVNIEVPTNMAISQTKKWGHTFLGRKLSGTLWTCPKNFWLLLHGKLYTPNRTGLPLPKENLPSILRCASTRAAAIPAVELKNDWIWWLQNRTRSSESSLMETTRFPPSINIGNALEVHHGTALQVSKNK